MKFIFTLFSLIFTSNCISQYFTIKGLVSDINGNPLEYTTIQSKRLKDHFLTNKVGFFSFKTPYTYDTLICKHANFEEKIEIIYKNDTVNFVLFPKQLLFKERLSIENQNNFIEDSALIKKWFEDKYQEELEFLCNRKMTSIVINAEYDNRYRDSLKFINDFKLEYKNKNYPSFIGFIKLGIQLNKDGKVKSISILKGINREIDKLVIETIKSLSKWKPSVQNGITLTSYIEIDIQSY